jgi:hypothetical protein
MYAEIFAKSEDNEASPGKRAWLNTGSNAPSIELETTRPDHLGKPPWHIRLSANSTRYSGTGERGGDMPATNYKMQADLTPADVVALVNFVLKHGLLEVVESASSRKRK